MEKWQREQEAKRIKESDILPADKDLLLKRLSVGSHYGCAAVVRDFEECMRLRRIKLLQSHQRFALGQFAPDNKQMVTLNVA